MTILTTAIVAVTLSTFSTELTAQATTPPTVPPRVPTTTPTDTPPTTALGGGLGASEGGGEAAITGRVVTAAGGNSSGGGGGGSGGASACTPWTPTFVSGVIGGDVISGYTDTAGQEWRFFSRTCNGAAETQPFPVVSGRDVSKSLVSEVVKRLPKPQASFAPPIDKMIVNFETWFGVTPVNPVSVDGSTLTLSATLTATPNHIELNTGSIVSGDTTTITCGLWGSITYAADWCTWTPVWPSVSKVTGTDDLRYHGSVAIVWDVAWTATDGTNGTFPQLRTTTPMLTMVMEIQTM